tara:strand:+ start:501 stop:1238 length:738 start_codon:yes stop_codon:yes gene_type:complete
MALIKCYECSKEISDMAESCPHCGAGKAIECHECSKQISKRLNKCPHCGAPKVRIFKINKPIKILFWLSMFGTSIYWMVYIGLFSVDSDDNSVTDGVVEYSREFNYDALVLVIICIPLVIISFKRLYKSIKDKRDINIKTYKVSSIRFNSRLHLISSLILLTSSCFLWTYLMQRTVLEFMFGVSGFIDIFGATIFITLVISLIYFIVSRLINKPTSFLKSLYLSSYILSLILIILSVIYSIKIWG